MHWVEHGADMVVGRDGGHAKQALAVRHLPPFLQRALVGEERLALHEEQREGRQADIRHAVGHLAVPLVGKGRAGRANALQKGLKHLHAGLNHTSCQSETLSSHQPFSIAASRRDSRTNGYGDVFGWRRHAGLAESDVRFAGNGYSSRVRAPRWTSK